jgi:hypothetical protein
LEAGGRPAHGIASWTGASWSDLGEGVDGWAEPVIVFEDGLGSGPTLYVRGWFNSVGGVSVIDLAALPATASSPAALVAEGFFGTSPSGDSYFALWQGCAVVRAGDLDGDVAVGSQGLAAVLADWGTSAGDLDGDGKTSAQDVAVLLGAADCRGRGAITPRVGARAPLGGSRLGISLILLPRSGWSDAEVSDGSVSRHMPRRRSLRAI